MEPIKTFIIQKVKTQLISSPDGSRNLLNYLILGRKNLDYQKRSDRLKTMDSESELQAMKTNPGISIERVSGEFGIS